MTVPFLVGADRHFRDMRVHGAVGEHEHDVGAAGAAIAPGLQLDRGQVGNEIGLPHVVARPHGDEIALAGKIRRLAGAIGEIEIGSEHEGFVVKDIHHHRQVRRGDQKRALGAAAVEVPVFGIERNGEQALGAPFEAALGAVGHFDLGRAGAFEHIDDFFVEVPLRRRGAAGRDVEHEHVGEIAAALEMHRRAVDAVARPRRGLDVEQVDAVILDDRNAFALEPIEIRVDAVARLLLRHFADVHVFLRACFARTLHRQPPGSYAKSSDLITTGTTPGGAISAPTST